MGGAGAPGAAGGSLAGGWTQQAAAAMAVEMVGVRIEPSSFRWFNSVNHRWAERGHGAGTLTWGVAGSAMQLRGGAGQPGAGLLGRSGRQPVEEGDPGDLGLDGLLEGQEVEEAAEGDGGGRSGEKGEMWARAAEARLAWSRGQAQAPQSMRALMQEA